MEKTNQYFKNKIINDKFVVTNSSLRAINPLQDGSPKKFRDFFEKESTIDITPSIERGNIIHKYHEKPEEFIISEKDKPVDGIVKWVDEINSALKYINKSEENYNNYFQGLQPTIKYKGKKPDDIENENEEFLNTAMLFAKTSGKFTNDLNQLLVLILASKESVNFNANLTTIVALEQLKVGLEYFEFLQEAEGKIMLSVAEKEKIESSISSLENHPIANSLLFDNVNIPNQYYTFKEHYIIYEHQKFYISGLIDNFHLDYINKQILLNDLKTTYNAPINYLPNDDYKGLVKTLHIDRQLAYYKFLIEKLLVGLAKLYDENGNEVFIPIINVEECQLWNTICYVIVVQTQDYYRTIIINLQNKTILDASEEIRQLWNRIVWHIDNDEWDWSREEIENDYIYKI